MLKYTNTPEAPKAIGPYSQAISQCKLLFISGQLPIDPKAEKITTTDIEGQTQQVIKNIEAILKANGVGFENVIKTVCFLNDMKNFKEFNEIYSKSFISKPARSCVAVKELPMSALVEIEAIVAL